MSDKEQYLRVNDGRGIQVHIEDKDIKYGTVPISDIGDAIFNGDSIKCEHIIEGVNKDIISDADAETLRAVFGADEYLPKNVCDRFGK